MVIFGSITNVGVCYARGFFANAQNDTNAVFQKIKLSF